MQSIIFYKLTRFDPFPSFKRSFTLIVFYFNIFTQINEQKHVAQIQS